MSRFHCSHIHSLTYSLTCAVAHYCTNTTDWRETWVPVIPSRILLCQCQCGYEEGGPVWRVPRGGRREVSAPLTHSLTHSLTTLITIPYILSFITPFATQPITSLTHSHSSLCNDSTLKLSSPHYSTHSLTHSLTSSLTQWSQPGQATTLSPHAAAKRHRQM